MRWLDLLMSTTVLNKVAVTSSANLRIFARREPTKEERARGEGVYTARHVSGTDSKIDTWPRKRDGIGTHALSRCISRDDRASAGRLGLARFSDHRFELRAEIGGWTPGWMVCNPPLLLY